MTRGVRFGFVTKQELVHRLRNCTRVPTDFAINLDAPVVQLLGHCKYYGLVSDLELRETTPFSESTIPCYFRSLISDEESRSRVSSFVVASSQMFLRGSELLNMLAQKLIGSRPAGLLHNMKYDVPVSRPRFDPASPEVAAIRAFVQLWDDLPPKGGHGAGQKAGRKPTASRRVRSSMPSCPNVGVPKPCL